VHVNILKQTKLVSILLEDTKSTDLGLIRRFRSDFIRQESGFLD
jgi:hypothetical protein